MLALLILAAAVLVPTAPRARERCPELAAGATTRPHGRGTGTRTGAHAGPVRAVVARLRRWTGRDAAPDPMRLLDAASALDLLAACLAAGMPPGDAAAATASASPPHLAGPLADASARSALGVAAPWAVLGDVPELSDLVALARRSGDSGAAMSAGAAELAAARRAEAGDAAEATSERSGVLIAGPLALCFLPAFVVLGLIPTIAGLAGSMLGPLTAGAP